MTMSGYNIGSTGSDLSNIRSRRKLSSANALLIGIRGLGSEIAKAMVLSGINSLMILDEDPVSKDEQLVNFLLSPNCIGKNIAQSVLAKTQALNVSVKLKADPGPLSEKDENFLKQFNVIIATRLSADEIIALSHMCRSAKVKFICSDVYGMFGYIVTDFYEHEFLRDPTKVPKKRRYDERKLKPPENVPPNTRGRILYPDLATVLKHTTSDKAKKCNNIYYYLMLVLLDYKCKHKRDLSYSHQQEDIERLYAIWMDIAKQYQMDLRLLTRETFELVFGEVVPVCSIISNAVVQETIKIVSGKGDPINNVFLLNPLTYYGREETLGVVPEEKDE